MGKLDERMIILLNIDRILSREEKLQLQKMAGASEGAAEMEPALQA